MLSEFGTMRAQSWSIDHFVKYDDSLHFLWKLELTVELTYVYERNVILIKFRIIIENTRIILFIITILLNVFKIRTLSNVSTPLRNTRYVTWIDVTYVLS